MLKSLAIFSVFLVMFSIKAHPQAYKAQQKDSKLTATAPSVGVEQTASPRLQTDEKKHVDADVVIVKTPKKDAFDIASLLISIVLGLVGIVGVGVGVGTLLFLKKQTVHMGSQVELMQSQLAEMKAESEISKDAVNAAYGSVRFAEAQFELMKEKERARLSVKAGRLKVGYPETDYWHLETSIEIRNIGVNRAFMKRAEGYFVVSSEGKESSVSGVETGSIEVPEYIDPADSQVSVSLYIFKDDLALSLKDLADDLYGNKRMLHLHGFIDYETIGMMQRKEFDYFWMAGSMIGMFGSERTETTEAERVEEGHWWNNRTYDNGDDQQEAT
jgi:hypothetical protein